MSDALTRSYSDQISVSDTPIRLCGWVDAVRDHGHLLFVHLRDIRGIVQLVFDSEKQADIYKQAQTLRSEFVIDVTGIAEARSDDTINPNLPTGKLEINVQALTILNRAETPPFMISEKDMFGNENADAHYVDEDIRISYRYLDLRRSSMQQNFVKRSKMIKAMRDYLDSQEFLDVETPVLTKSTPEGARDYLVPSRTHENKFFALPQSPQLFKQLLMVSGFDRYYQVVKCFRDEDLRPNRQPEFTQLDLEASFIDETFIYDLIEGLMVDVAAVCDIKLPTPFPRLTYDEAMNRYGSDAPDLRFDMPLCDVTDILPDSGYKIFNTIVKNGGLIKGMRIPGQAAALSKNVLQNEFAMSLIQKMGGKGMTWMKLENGEFLSNIVQFFTQDELNQIKDRLSAEDGDVLVFVADTDHHLVNTVLGKFRVFIADRQGLIPENTYAPCWVTNFPLFDPHESGVTSTHHPFTQPDGPLPERLDQASLLDVKSRAYDVVLNGEEVGGGSIRIHDPEVQSQIFDILGLTDADIEQKFGFFINALKYGAPPHGGLALGVDRLVSILLGVDSIREVIAFPKNRVAYCPLTQAPSTVDDKQLSELNLKSIPSLV